MYKDINENDIINALDFSINKDNQTSGIIGFSSEDVSLKNEGIENITKNKKEIIDISLKIKSGEILTTDILNEQEKYKNENLDEYNKILDEYNINTNLDSDSFNEESDSDFVNNKVIDSYSSNTIEMLMNYNDITYSALDDLNRSFNEQEISNLLTIKTLSKIINILDFTNKIVSATSIALNVVAFGVAAFYWSPWWMFGANIPFAIAATVQAATLLVFNGFAINDMIELDKQIKNSEGIFGNSEIDNMSDNVFMDSLSSINNLGSFISNKVMETSFEIWLQKIISGPGKSFLKSSCKELIKSASIKIPLITAKQTVLYSTVWANPIITFIGTISSIISSLGLIISICSIILNLTLGFII